MTEVIWITLVSISVLGAALAHYLWNMRPVSSQRCRLHGDSSQYAMNGRIVKECVGCEIWRERDARRERARSRDRMPWRPGVAFRQDGLMDFSGLGFPVRSSYEAHVALWLQHHEVRFVYEPEILGYRPDFYVPEKNCIIEVWGLEEDSYKERRAEKTRTYQREGYLLINIEAEDIRRGDFENKLIQLLTD